LVTTSVSRVRCGIPVAPPDELAEVQGHVRIRNGCLDGLRKRKLSIRDRADRMAQHDEISGEVLALTTGSLTHVHAHLLNPVVDVTRVIR
jgi:hypothetical protein